MKIDRLKLFKEEYSEDVEILKRTNPEHISIWNGNRYGLKKSGLDISGIISDERIIEMSKCQDDIYYFIENYIFIQTRNKDEFGNRYRLFQLRKYQREQIELYLNHRFVLLMYPRRSGKTSGTVAYFLWRMMFESNFIILCLANKNTVAMKLIAEIRRFIKLLPLWMVEGIEKANEHEIVFENGSRISSSATTEDAGRSEGAHIVYVDECLDYESLITLKKKDDSYIEKIKIGEFFERINSCNEKIILRDNVFVTEQYQILTKDGFCDFRGIRKLQYDSTIQLFFSDGSDIKCSPNHKIFTSSGYQYAELLKVDDDILDSNQNEIKIIRKEITNEKIDLFDILHVENETHNYISNNIISSNCAFIDNNIWEPFFGAVFPVVTDGDNSQFLGTSTPNGLNHFWKLWEEGSEVDSEGNIIRQGTSEFLVKTIKWNDVPGRDEDFKRRTIATVGQDQWNQDFDCQFLGSAGTLLDADTLKKMVKRTPLRVFRVLDDYDLKIYQEPDKTRKYIVTHDPASGHGGEHDDNTAIIVWDVKDLYAIKQVAVLYDKNLDELDAPFVLHKICKMYNNALEISERNKAEGIPMKLKREMDYENVFCDEKGFAGIHQTESSRNVSIALMRRFIKEGKIDIVDAETIFEFSTFIKRAGKYQADTGKHDDLVMSTSLLCFLLSDEKNFDKYFTGTSLYQYIGREDVYNDIFIEDSENSLNLMGNDSFNFEDEIGDDDLPDDDEDDDFI